MTAGFHFRSMKPHPLLYPVAIVSLTSAGLARDKAVDADGDGIPRNWEDSRGMSDSNPADALVDFDRDGLTNYEDYLTGGRPWGNP